MHKVIEKALDKLYPHSEDKYSIRDCAHNRFLNGDYDTLKEFEYELWVKNNPDIIAMLKKEVDSNGVSDI